MNPVKLFRSLVGASVALMAANIAAVFLESEPPEQVTAWFSEEGSGVFFSMLDTETSSGLIGQGLAALVFMVAWLASTLGMLGFRRWARTTFIVTTIITYAMLPLMGHTYHTPIQGTIDGLFYTCTGAILVLLFVDPIRSRFLPAHVATA